MNNPSHIHHFHSRLGYHYPVSASQQFYSLVLTPLIALGLAFVVIYFFGSRTAEVSNVTISTIILALLTTFARLLVAFFFALILSVPAAILITHNKLTERLLLPLFDIIQSVPILAFFPIIIIMFIRYNLFNQAAIFIIFLTMIWNLVFPLVGGLHTIPNDIKAMAHVFGIKGRNYIAKIIIPALVPYIVVGSLLAWAQSWNIIIVAEVLHTYIPGGNSSQDLFGIGSILVNASANAQDRVFFYALAGLIIAIIIINLFVWQKLLKYAEQFKFD